MLPDSNLKEGQSVQYASSSCMAMQETKIFWDFRKGLVPIVGGSRAVGTQVRRSISCNFQPLNPDCQLPIWPN